MKSLKNSSADFFYLMRDLTYALPDEEHYEMQRVSIKTRNF